mmetsp:Transcript_13171/g.29177  ORF Transcript_13171/g.29177 Transcript_13171/m.29177 type:complete len:215 (-) Transcript_13171:120-764(-)
MKASLEWRQWKLPDVEHHSRRGPGCALPYTRVAGTAQRLRYRWAQRLFEWLSSRKRLLARERCRMSARERWLMMPNRGSSGRAESAETQEVTRLWSGSVANSDCTSRTIESIVHVQFQLSLEIFSISRYRSRPTMGCWIWRRLRSVSGKYSFGGSKGNWRLKWISMSYSWFCQYDPSPPRIFIHQCVTGRSLASLACTMVSFRRAAPGEVIISL